MTHNGMTSEFVKKYHGHFPDFLDVCAALKKVFSLYTITLFLNSIKQCSLCIGQCSCQLLAFNPLAHGHSCRQLGFGKYSCHIPLWHLIFSPTGIHAANLVSASSAMQYHRPCAKKAHRASTRVILLHSVYVIMLLLLIVVSALSRK